MSAADPLLIQSDDGMWLLADSEEEARTWLAECEPDMRIIGEGGWMHNVGWNRHEYESKEDFDRESGYNAWWEGCGAPPNGVAVENCRLAFEVGYDT